MLGAIVHLLVYALGCVCFCIIFFCGMLWCVYVSTFVILSPADYQNILAELRSPAALHSNPHFLEPELPVTPNLSLTHHQCHLYPEPDTPLLANSQPLPWSPELESNSGEPDGPPRSPPRPCELALSFPAFELPNPISSKVRKPHIALNDQLLLSEEEDRSCQEMELSHKPKSHSPPAMCELDIHMAYSTSSPSFSSVSSLTPSSTDRAQMESGGAQIGSPNGAEEEVSLKEGTKEVKVEIEKVVEMVAAQEAQGNGLVEWVEKDLIKDVERKCEMITQDRCKLAENLSLLEQKEGSSEEEKNELLDIKDGEGEVKDAQTISEELGSGQELDEKNKIEAETVKVCFDETLGVQQGDGNSEETVCQAAKMDGELQLKVREGLCGSQRDICGSSEGGGVAVGLAVDQLSPQAWVVALGECHCSDSGSSEEEEEEGDKGLTEEPLGSLTEEVEKVKGSEEKKEFKEMTEASVEEIFDQVEQTEKEVYSLVGWHSDSSSVNVEPPTPGRSVSSDLLDRRER